MDVDLQDPPELIPEMVQHWRDGSNVVYAQRRERTGETLVKRTIAKVGYRVINRFSEVPIPPDTGDFRLIDRTVVDHLRQFPETHGFLRGLVALVGFEQTADPVRPTAAPLRQRGTTTGSSARSGSGSTA